MDEFELLSKLISINSIFPNEEEIGNFLEQYLKDIGFNTQRQYVSEKRFNVLADNYSLGVSDKEAHSKSVIMFYGHMDTVPPYGKWTKDPLKTWQEEDRQYGLGSWDMKSGIAAILKTIEKVGTRRRIKVAFGVDEENISLGAHTLAKSNFLDDVSLIIVTESGLNDKGISGPSMITLGRRGRAVYKFTIEGKSAHGGSIKSGINAISEAALLTLELDKMNKKLKKHKLLPPPTQFVRNFSGATESLSIPEIAVIEVDRHLVPPQTPQSELKEYEKVIKKLEKSGKIKAKIRVEIKPRSTPYLAPYVTDNKLEEVMKLSKIVEKKFGKVYYNYALSVADENILSTKKPVITIGTKGSNEHAADEWVSKKSYLNLIEILTKFLIDQTKL